VVLDPRRRGDRSPEVWPAADSTEMRLHSRSQTEDLDGRT
jgi:hypothetical protein